MSYSKQISVKTYISARSRQPIKLNPLENESRMDTEKSLYKSDFMVRIGNETNWELGITCNA